MSPTTPTGKGKRGKVTGDKTPPPPSNDDKKKEGKTIKSPLEIFEEFETAADDFNKKQRELDEAKIKKDHLGQLIEKGWNTVGDKKTMELIQVSLTYYVICEPLNIFGQKPTLSSYVRNLPSKTKAAWMKPSSLALLAEFITRGGVATYHHWASPPTTEKPTGKSSKGFLKRMSMSTSKVTPPKDPSVNAYMEIIMQDLEKKKRE